MTGLTHTQFMAQEIEKLKNINLNEECAICLEELKEREQKFFPCLKHAAHKDCVDLWVET